MLGGVFFLFAYRSVAIVAGVSPGTTSLGLILTDREHCAVPDDDDDNDTFLFTAHTSETTCWPSDTLKTRETLGPMPTPRSARSTKHTRREPAMRANWHYFYTNKIMLLFC